MVDYRARGLVGSATVRRGTPTTTKTSTSRRQKTYADPRAAQVLKDIGHADAEKVTVVKPTKGGAVRHAPVRTKPAPQPKPEYAPETKQEIAKAQAKISEEAARKQIEEMRAKRAAREEMQRRVGTPSQVFQAGLSKTKGIKKQTRFEREATFVQKWQTGAEKRATRIERWASVITFGKEKPIEERKLPGKVAQITASGLLGVGSALPEQTALAVTKGYVIKRGRKESDLYTIRQESKRAAREAFVEVKKPETIISSAIFAGIGIKAKGKAPTPRTIKARVSPTTPPKVPPSKIKAKVYKKPRVEVVGSGEAKQTRYTGMDPKTGKEVVISKTEFMKSRHASEVGRFAREKPKDIWADTVLKEAKRKPKPRDKRVPQKPKPRPKETKEIIIREKEITPRKTDITLSRARRPKYPPTRRKPTLPEKAKPKELELPKPKPLEKTKPKAIEKVREKPLEEIKPRPLEEVKPKDIIKAEQLRRPKPREKPKETPAKRAKKPLGKILPFGDIGFGDTGGGGLLQRLGFGRKPRGRKGQYAPSLSARTFGIYGKKPGGQLTGLEQRPLLGKPSKGKKKKKKKNPFMNIDFRKL